LRDCHELRVVHHGQNLVGEEHVGDDVGDGVKKADADAASGGGGMIMLEF
jgi:hypothetical protein